MENKSITAMMCLFARSNHQQYDKRVLDDNISPMLISDEEYQGILKSLEESIDFFETDDVSKAINKHIAPAVIGRDAYALSCIKTEARLGAKRLIILGAGYGTIAYSPACRGMEIWEADRSFNDKIGRLRKVEISIDDISFSESVLPEIRIPKSSKKTVITALGLVYYLSKKEFEETVKALSELTAEGSSLIFDYPDEKYCHKLLSPQGEIMKAKYGYREIEALLDRQGFKIYELLTPKEIESRFFSEFNQVYDDRPLIAEAGVNYCLAVKK